MKNGNSKFIVCLLKMLVKKKGISYDYGAHQQVCLFCFLLSSFPSIYFCIYNSSSLILFPYITFFQFQIYFVLFLENLWISFSFIAGCHRVSQSSDYEKLSFWGSRCSVRSLSRVCHRNETPAAQEACNKRNDKVIRGDLLRWMPPLQLH